MVTYYFITSELTGSLRTILVLSGYNLSCLKKGFEGGAKIQFCFAHWREIAQHSFWLRAQANVRVVSTSIFTLFGMAFSVGSSTFVLASCASK